MRYVNFKYMVLSILLSGFLIGVLFFALSHAYGQAPDTLHWDLRTQRRLAQCFIAEADEETEDWTAIADTLDNWLEVRQRRYPALRLIDVILTTCSVHKLSDRSRSPRQRWIRQLDFPVADAFRKPPSFPRASSWKRKQHYWAKALQHAQLWRAGRLKSPCRGKPVIWGAPRDPNSRWHLPSDDPIIKGWKVVRLPCSDRLSNDYYRLMTKSELQALPGV